VFNFWCGGDKRLNASEFQSDPMQYQTICHTFVWKNLTTARL